MMYYKARNAISCVVVVLCGLLKKKIAGFGLEVQILVSTNHEIYCTSFEEVMRQKFRTFRKVTRKP